MDACMYHAFCIRVCLARDWGLRVRASPASLRCVLEQGALPKRRTPLLGPSLLGPPLAYADHITGKQKEQKSRINVFCLPVDPLSLRHNLNSCDASTNTRGDRGKMIHFFEIFFFLLL